MNEQPLTINAFVEFPKISRLSRDCIITGLTSSEFSPYFVYEQNEQVSVLWEGFRDSPENKSAEVLQSEVPLNEMDRSKSGASKFRRKAVSRSQVCSGRLLAGRGRKVCRSQGVDGRTEIKTLHRLRRRVPDLLYGLRPPQGRKESLQHRMYVRASLQPRTHSNRSGQMRLGLCQLPQNTNP